MRKVKLERNEHLRVNVKDLKIGEMMRVEDSDSEYNGHILLRTYNNVVSLNDPECTWGHFDEEEGELTYLPSLHGILLKGGDIVTLYA